MTTLAASSTAGSAITDSDVDSTEPTIKVMAKRHTSLLYNTAVPEELLVSLSSAASKNTSSHSAHHHHCKLSGLKKLDAVWHHPLGREKYKHLLDRPASVAGAGRDVSFLCDTVVTHKKTALPPLSENSGTSTSQNLSHLESLVPEEYHIVRNKGINSLKLYEDAFTVQLEDDDHKLRVFPSLQPSGRLEAIQLIGIMDDMLDKAGVGHQSEELTEFSQMESLMEMVHSEQKIYNIVFHEVIRQVSVECVERGQLLAKLRQRYQSLLERIPQRLKSLHTQAVAERASGRRLTEEMSRVKSIIQHLSEELCKIREHDAAVSQQAEVARQQLSEVLDHTNTNSFVVQSYHELYELQRSRLQAELLQMTEERDRWSRITFCLALKVISVKKLQQVSNLHLSAQSWFKTAEHCGLSISAKDTDAVGVIVEQTDQWEEKLRGFIAHLKNRDGELYEKILAMQQRFSKWIQICSNNGCMDPKCLVEIHADLQQWIEMLTLQCELYQGEQLLFCQQTVAQLVEQQERWLDRSLQLYRAHPDDKLPSLQMDLRDLDSFISEHQKHLDLYFTGETGIYRHMLSLLGLLKPWLASLDPLKMTSDFDLSKLGTDLQSCQTIIEELVPKFSAVQTGGHEEQNMINPYTESENIFKRLQEFRNSLTQFAECESQKLLVQIRSINKAQVQWMLDLLLLLVPDHTESQNEEHDYVVNVSLQTLEDDNNILIEKLFSISKTITRCCQQISEENIHPSLHDEEDKIMDACRNLENEGMDWVTTSKSLLSELRHVANVDGENATEKAEALGELSTREAPVLNMLGRDGYIVKINLPQENVKLNESEELIVTPTTEKAHKAFRDLTTVGLLQKELLNSEQQLQNTEQRALQAEESLQAALEKIQELEMKLQDFSCAGPKDNEGNKKTPTPPPSAPTSPAPSPAPVMKPAPPKKAPAESKPTSKKSKRR